MADVSIRLAGITFDKAGEREAMNGSGVKAAVTAAASGVAGKANAMSSGNRTKRVTRGYPFPPDRTTRAPRDMGGKSPSYESSPAMSGRDGAVSIVYTGNYAAMKDNSQGNTLLKAR